MNFWFKINLSEREKKMISFFLAFLIASLVFFLQINHPPKKESSTPISQIIFPKEAVDPVKSFLEKIEFFPVLGR